MQITSKCVESIQLSEINFIQNGGTTQIYVYMNKNPKSDISTVKSQGLILTPRQMLDFTKLSSPFKYIHFCSSEEFGDVRII